MESLISMAWTLAEIGSEWDNRWDALAAACRYSGFMQSSAWAAFKRAEGYCTPRFGLFDGDTLVGGASLLTFPSASSEGMILCADGPVLPWDDYAASREGLRLLIASVEEIAEQSGGLGWRIEPRVGLPRPMVLKNWKRAPVDLNPAHSLVIDLRLPPDQILAAMHPKGRYNIRVAARHGVRAVRSNAMQDLRRFYSLFAETALRNGFFAEPFGFFINLVTNLFPAGMAELCFAELGSETLAASLVIYYGQRATYLYGGSSSRYRNCMPTYQMHWCAIQSAQQRGCLEYDMYGFDPFEQPDHPYAGFSRFKKQFGGSRFDAIGAHDLIFYDRLADQLAARLRQST